jgi:hypothetical protein
MESFLKVNVVILCLPSKLAIWSTILTYMQKKPDKDIADRCHGLIREGRNRKKSG